MDLLDQGGVLARLLKWTDSANSVSGICSEFRSHLLTAAAEPWAGDFYRDMRALCRDLGRAVGQPEERPVGKCASIRGDEPCRGQLLRLDHGGVYCRRCGDKPALTSREVWLTDRETALAVGRPLETIRTWIKRGRAGFPSPIWAAGQWSSPIGPAPSRRAWLPTAVVLATLPQTSAIVNHGSRAELSTDSLGSDADVLAQEVGRLTQPGTVTPSASRGAGKAVAPIPLTSGSLVWAEGAGSTAPGDHLDPGANP